MKKILFLTLLTCFAVFVFCACSNSDTKAVLPQQTATTQSPGEGVLTDSRQESTTERPEVLTPQCAADYIGMSKRGIIEAMGNDYTLEYYEGSYGLYYAEKNLWFGFDQPLHTEDDEITDDMFIKYVLFGLKSGKIVYDIQPGMTYDEIAEGGTVQTLSSAEYSEYDECNVASARLEYNGRMLDIVFDFDPTSSIFSSGKITFETEEESTNQNI